MAARCTIRSTRSRPTGTISTSPANSRSFTTGGNLAGQDDAILLTYDVSAGPGIETSQFTTELDGNNEPTTVNGLVVTGTDPSEILTLTATTEQAAFGSTITPSSGTGDLAAINAVIDSVVYDPGGDPPLTDKVTFTVSGASGTDTVNFIFNQAGNGPGISLQGTDGKDVIFATEDSDTLTGGGGADQFVFPPTSSDPVQHTITDFETPLDKLDLREFAGIDGLEDITVAQQLNGDTLITLDGNDIILLENVLASNLHPSNFLFHSILVTPDI